MGFTLIAACYFTKLSRAQGGVSLEIQSKLDSYSQNTAPSSVRQTNLKTTPPGRMYAFARQCFGCLYQHAIVIDSVSRAERTSRRIPLSRRSHITGFQPLAIGVAEHESALERDFVTLTSFLDADASIAAQPITLTFRHEGRARRYTPDYLVRGRCRAELVEVKYQADFDANGERLRPAFDAARRWASENCAAFRIVTEHDIRGPMLMNAKRLVPLRGLPVDRETAIRVLTAVGSLSAPSFGRVVAALKTSRSRTLATVWRLIARGELRVDLAVPITLHTRLAFP